MLESRARGDGCSKNPRTHDTHSSTSMEDPPYQLPQQKMIPRTFLCAISAEHVRKKKDAWKMKYHFFEVGYTRYSGVILHLSKNNAVSHPCSLLHVFTSVVFSLSPSPPLSLTLSPSICLSLSPILTSSLSLLSKPLSPSQSSSVHHFPCSSSFSS